AIPVQPTDRATLEKIARMGYRAVQFSAVATDLLTGETVAIDTGPLVDAVMASIAIPGIFRPVVHMGRLLTDGGVADPLPIDVLKMYRPDITIACNLHPRMTTRYSMSARKDFVEAERHASVSEKDLASSLVDRLAGMLNARVLPEGMAPLARTLREKLGASLKGSVADMETLKGIREFLSQQIQRMGEMRLSALATQNDSHRMNIIEILLNATNIQQYQKNRLMLKYEPPDVLIEPDVVDIAALEFTKSALAIEEGRKKALEAVPVILRLMEERSGAVTSR
ncbi:MAG TPA: patatin-like phospholipase family protein, partial [Deltaproteobacteria bacterium]|nr:patatin-like phospholipase family protein [Deltaproteobacteria bacterium]